MNKKQKKEKDAKKVYAGKQKIKLYPEQNIKYFQASGNIITQRNKEYPLFGKANPMFNHKFSQSHKDGIRKAKMGKLNPQWKEGISFEPYTADFNIQLKEKVRNRDGYRCRDCGISESNCQRKLDIHHIDEDKQNNDYYNLIALCQNCHSKITAGSNPAEVFDI